MLKFLKRVSINKGQHITLFRQFKEIIIKTARVVLHFDFITHVVCVVPRTAPKISQSNTIRIEFRPSVKSKLHYFICSSLMHLMFSTKLHSCHCRFHLSLFFALCECYFNTESFYLQIIFLNVCVFPNCNSTKKKKL